MKGFGSLSLGFVLLLAGAGPVASQGSAAIPVPYRLHSVSTAEIGCQGPCACPVLTRQPVLGTFQLALTGDNGLYKTYAVNEVAWRIADTDPPVRITGSGVYRYGGEVALTQQMTLDLTVGDGEVQHFDSGLVPAQNDFPIIRVAVAVNGFFCYDTVLTITAEPATTGVDDGAGVLSTVSLKPNPFRTSADLEFGLRAAAPLSIAVHDVAGRLVTTLARGQWFAAGRHVVTWDGRNADGGAARAGLYFVRILAGNEQRDQAWVKVD